MALLIKWKFPLFVSILLSVVYVYCFVNKAVVELDINVSQTTWFKIYWVKEGQLFSEKKMVRVRVRPDQEHYSFFLTDLRAISTLRIDSHQYTGEALIKKLVINQKGFHPFRFEEDGDFSRLDPIFDVARSQFLPQGFVVESTGKDPQFRYPVDLQKSSFSYLQEFVRILCIFIAIFCFFYLTKDIRHEAQYIPLLFAAVFSLVIVMASISGGNTHPDEYVHYGASQYYMTNWLPPAADDPSIRDTYSVYGVSRLNNHEVAYFFLGKFAQLLTPFKLPDYLKLRMFNVLLFGVILLCIFRYEEVRLPAVPFLLTPQLWYVFSYCDSDAFALFISFVVSCQVVLPGSMLNSWLKGENNNNSAVKVVLFGLVCALLFLLKTNYYFFIVFVFGYLVWCNLFYDNRVDIKRFCKRIFLVIFVGLCLAGLRIGIEYSVNGLDRSSKIAELREELADPLYKPSTPLEQKHSHLYRKAKGESLEEFIKIQRWFGKTFRSTFGVYGYFTASASRAYYDSVRLAGTAFLVYCVFAVLIRGGMAGNLLLAYCFCCATGLIGASIWHSWTADFQAQGRYLFPIIPMLSILIVHIRPFLPTAGFRLLLLSAFMLSFYSFVYVALLNIPKA